jgi:DNA-binding NtrC family response regulator
VHSVLVVDDERGVRDSLRLILEPQFRVLTADRGTVALRILQQERISVMTLDLRMPGWSGPETLLKIREIDSDLEVVIVSAYSSYTEAMRALRLRAFDLVAKPFDAKQILETVGRAVLRCETRRGTASSYEALDGLTNRLIKSIHGLSVLEFHKLARGKQAQLADLRERAQKLVGQLSDARVSRVRRV